MPKIDHIQIKVTTAGSAGSAVGSASSSALNGKLLAVHVDYTSQPATTDVTITANSPSMPILTLTNANTDAWKYPRQLMDGITGSALTGVYEPLPIYGAVTVAVAQGDAVTDGVVVTLVIERE
ncbi:MAG: hypothetical protein SFZ02_19175 [bacterium]|nr:hypothetical protein [bacterium]